MRGMMMTPEPELDAVLSELLASARSVLAQRFVGMYLHGSVALGDFDRHSDVDFVVAISGEVDQDQLSALQAMHARIYALDSRWAQHLEGSYLTTDALRQVDADAPEHLYLDHGSSELIRSHHDHTLLHRYVLREHGITLVGPEPKCLVQPVSPERLRTVTFDLLNSWMPGFLADPVPLQNGWRQPYTVLTLCRLLYTVHHAAVVSKRVAAEWAMNALDPEWPALIERAWAARPDPALKARQRAPQQDVLATIGFIQYALALATSGGVGSLPLDQREASWHLRPYDLGIPTS